MMMVAKAWRVPTVMLRQWQAGRNRQGVIRPRSFLLATTRSPPHRQSCLSKIVMDPAAAATAATTTTRLFSSSLPTNNEYNSNWNVGDAVQIPLGKDKSAAAAAAAASVPAVIEEIRGSGWYTVRLTATQELKKVRTSQLLVATATAPAAATTSTKEEPPTPPPAAAIPPPLDELPIEASAVQAMPAMTINVDSSARYPVDATAPPPPPKMDDLDALLREVTAMTTTSDASTNSASTEEFIQQLAHHATVDKWVVFTDLHCAPSTLDTTLQVLQKVHECAMDRNAGILFLGDFWHHRGTLRVDCLNAVLDELGTWKVPMIMIPGNHDQVTLGGHSHGLTPLEHAYRVKTTSNITASSTTGSSKSVPGPLVFSHPTLFAGALFVPHIRDIAILESVLQSDMAQHKADSIFVHADVTGAYMNDLIVSTGGVHPSVFPSNKPIYSGHFHKPHTVTHGGKTTSTNNNNKKEDNRVVIEYFGSPYETTLAEAQQAKALVVLDATQQWNCVERIPMSIGRKHYKPHSVAELLALSLEQDKKKVAVRQGDRIVVTLPRKEMNEVEELPDVVDHIRYLRKGGVTVEVREAKDLNETVPAMASEDAQALEDLTPVSTWKRFWEEQVHRGVIDKDETTALQETGLDILDELDDSTGDASPARDFLLATPTNLELDSVTVEGYGPFSGQVYYPLKERGLVLLRGSNRDGGSDSNGSGKTSLAMAALWALTGSADPRPYQDNKVSDVVHDAKQNARVTITGNLNGCPFAITRTKSPKKSGLAFILDGRDLTTQSAKETMAVIEEKLGVSAPILARTMFHGQHALNDLLEATDAKFKEELSLITPLELWQAAAKLTRANAKDATKTENELCGKMSLRTEDIEKLQTRRDKAAAEMTVREESLAAKENEIETNSKAEHPGDENQQKNNESRESLRKRLAEAKSSVDKLQTKARDISEERDLLLRNLDINLTRDAQATRKATEEYQSAQLKFQSVTQEVETLLKSIQSLQETWQVDLSLGEIPVGFKVPDSCPTCHQPLSVAVPVDSHGHDHHNLQAEAEEEMLRTLVNLKTARLNLSEIEEELEGADRIRKDSDQNVLNVQGEIKTKAAYWDEVASATQDELNQFQVKVTELTESYTVSFERQQRATLEESLLESQLNAEREAARYAKEAYRELAEETDNMEAAVEQLKANIIEYQGISKRMSSLSDAFGNRGIQTFVLQNAVNDLESLAQSYLDEFSDGAQRLLLTLDAGDRISRRSLVREADGTFRDRPLATLSGGQWRRSSLALTLGFADLVAQRGKLRPSLIVMDEPLTHLDRAGRSDVGKVLRNILGRSNGASATNSDDPNRQTNSIRKLSSVSTIIMILQDLAAEELEEAFDRIDEVVKQDGSSSVKVDETSN